MKAQEESIAIHPEGDEAKTSMAAGEQYPLARKLETFGGIVEVEWDPRGGMGMHGGLVYFIEFLKVSGLWEKFVDECPLTYRSPNAPSKSEILGTILFSVLSGHRRYAHISGISGDAILPGLLGISQFRSEDSVRRAFEKADEEALTLWMDKQMDVTYAALLRQEWILDLDGTVKTLYGRQEEARVGYNPGKPGRPSHIYHSMILTAAKLVLNVDTMRGDIGYGNDAMMLGCEERGLVYLFKLKITNRVGELLVRMERSKDGADWSVAGKGWEGAWREIQLQGWDKKRRVLVLRRRIAEAAREEQSGQFLLGGEAWKVDGEVRYEYAVLATNLGEGGVLGVAQLYRDRADAENVFDELKNQWGWTGYSTKDLKRSQLMARMVALIFNWWSIFTRMGTGKKHGEAITTRPMFQQAVVRRTKHANQTRLSISSIHAKACQAAGLLDRISSWLKKFMVDAEQLQTGARWDLMLHRIFAELGGFALNPDGPQGALA